MYLLSLEWFKYVKCFVGVLACNGFDVAKYIYMYVFSLFLQRENKLENCYEQGSLFRLGSVLYSL